MYEAPKAGNGKEFFPWVMPYVDDWSLATIDDPATTGVNMVDNVEQVWIAAPPVAGNYTVRVDHTGTLTNDEQVFSLVVDGGSLEARQPVSDYNS